MSDLERDDSERGPEASPPFAPVALYDDEQMWAASTGANLMIVLVCLALASGGSVVGGVGALYFGARIVYLARRLIGKVPRVLLTEDGVIDRSFFYSVGLIPWEDIVEVRHKGMGMVNVTVRDPDKLLAPLGVHQLFMIGWMQLWGFGPIAINSWTLDRTSRELVDLLDEGMDAYALRALRSDHELGSGADRDDLPDGEGCGVGDP
jgi:hypothetical protein